MNKSQHMPHVFDRFPDEQDILGWYREEVPEINTHIHTPWSFSAFETIEQAFKLASAQHLALLGINDFITAGGFPEFMSCALKYRIFPLFSVEFITLLENMRDQGVRVNDPNNPGRTYFCGKGFPFPFHPPQDFSRFLDDLVERGNTQLEEMTGRVASHLASHNPALHLSWKGIREELATLLVRERHLARAVRIAMEKEYPDPQARIDLYKKIFAGVSPNAAVDNLAALENEIRSRLLKKGGVAFVPEDPQTFPPLEKVRDMIVKAGGIPCYPVLLDNASGDCTDFEQDPERLAAKLHELQVHAVEFIPSRNEVNRLADGVRFLSQKGFLVLFGTEHNTPSMVPLKVSARNNVPLPEDIHRTGWESACVVAAHQYRVSRGEPGYVNPDGSLKTGEQEWFVRLGNAVIHYFRNQK